MPETRDIALGAWVVVLLGVAWRGGAKQFLSTLLLGAGPAVVLATLFSDSLSPITGLYPKHEVEAEKKKALTLERKRTERRDSGGESLDWMNVIMKQLWPHIAKYVEDMIKGYEHMIQGYLPVGGSQIKFTTCTLGKEHLNFGPVKTRLVDSNFDGKTLENNGVELEIDVSYNSDVDIVLSSPIASIGIADIRINGTLSVIFRPLIPKSPFIGGMEVLFTNPPEIELDFKGLGNVADMPGIYTAVRTAIHDAIGGIMVSPNRKAFAISGDPAVDLAYLRNPQPEGVLRITIFKAENLEGNDIGYNPFAPRTSDPYVEVKIGSSKWRTPTIDKNCNPVWKENNINDFFYFSPEQLVHIDVFDEDKLSDDDSLGMIKRYSVQQLLDMTSEEPLALPLERRSQKDNEPPAGARLYLRVDLLRMSELAAANVQLGLNRYVLCFKIDECDGLPEEGLDAPFTIKMSVDGHPERSRSTGKGWPKYSPSMTPETLKRISKLADSGTSSAVIAEVVGVAEERIQGLIAEKLPRGSNDKKCAEWIKKLEADRHARETSTNPQFEEVLRLPVPERGFSAVVELLNSSKKHQVVARFEVQIGITDVVEGPFVLQDPKTGKPVSKAPGMEAHLHGTFTLYGLTRCEHGCGLRPVLPVTRRQDSEKEWGCFSPLRGSCWERRREC